MKNLVTILMILILVSCKTSTGNDDNNIILGPENGTYDYYVGISYSGDQSNYPDTNYLYVIIANETDDEIETIELKVDDETIALEYANYEGRVFYIAYFYLDVDDMLNVKLTVNEQQCQIDVPTISVLNCTLPNDLQPNEDISINWTINEDPQVIYVEGFQFNSSNEIVGQDGENLPADARNFTIPADWLWSASNIDSRSIQVGITNFVVQDRIAVVMSDGAYKNYVSNK
ncbi:MAG: hypothetical protein K9N09_05725 [Candidatus Cloacimonetes bacterium]|nr:hypothetical protein [Candidatus Cloacimonadota bacterium]MCF7814698.1 hypothetical protein [Candidatus Cloacimonadota bacterium]MCF7868181.1 hypothetical protein [Candidatus Cloacimonadota bacterium]MCF7884467.1 hypothetical protein [Candidatus Cloacimonadota bacterium]